MNKKVKKALVLSVGIIFIILGFFGLVLPFLQGIIFLIVGILLLSFYFPRARLWMDTHTKKYPHIHAATKRIEKWMLRMIGEV